MEWRKAAYDVAEDRFWTETFGPYLTDNDQDRLGAVRNPRRTLMPGRWGVRDNPVQSQTGERDESRRLAAPAGTKLEIYDVAFCASGRFRDEGWCQGPDCSSPRHLQEAANAVRQWEEWRAAKQREFDASEAAAQQKVKAWEAWHDAKERERAQYWDVDPRSIAIRAELTAAEPDHLRLIAQVQALKAAHGTEIAAPELDHQARRATHARRQDIFNNRTNHWGICE